MWEMLSSYRGATTVGIVPQGAVIPKKLIFCHEHSDHFSLQTAVPCTHKELNGLLTEFMSTIEHISKEEYFKRFPFIN